MSDRLPRLWQAVVAVGFVSLVGVALLLYLVPPAVGYEMDIYEAYPLVFWALVVVALLASQALIVRSALGTDGDGSWRYGLGLLLAVEALVMALPYFRGYPVLGRGDVLTHVGHTRIIQETGAVADGNVYPHVHLFVASLSYATGVEPIHVINTITVAVTLFSILASFALVRAVYDRRTALVALPFLTLFVHGTAMPNASPFPQTSLLVPFVLYLFVRQHETGSFSLRAVLVLVVSSIVLYHPITALFLLLLLGVFVVVPPVQRVLTSAETTSQRRLPRSTPVMQVVIAIFLVWYSGFLKIVSRAEEVTLTLLSPESGGQSTLESYSSTVSDASPAVTDLLSIGALKYGSRGLLLAVGGLYLLVLLYGFVRPRWTARVDGYELAFAGGFALFVGLSVIFLVFDLIIGFARPLMYVVITAGLLVGPLFWTLDGTRLRPLVRPGLYATIVLLVLLGTFGLYHSPNKVSINQQVTDGELTGTEWFAENRNDELLTSQYFIDLHRFRDANYGTTGYTEELVFDADADRPPDHFNYTVYDTLGASYGRDHYLVFSDTGRTFYPEMYPEYEAFWRYTPTDFERLERDPTVAHVFDGGGFDTYRVTATRDE